MTPAPVTPAPVEPGDPPVTPAPVTPAPVTPAPVTPAPVGAPTEAPTITNFTDSGNFTDGGNLENERIVAGKGVESIAQPKWANDKNARFDPVYAALLEIAKAGKKGNLLYRGNLAWNWRPAGSPDTKTILSKINPAAKRSVRTPK